jgi:hypothetical protein
MPDTALLPDAQPIDYERADGFLVVAQRLQALPALPPRQYSYRHDYFDSLNDASDLYDDLERGEFREWEPVAICACRGGVPFAKLGHFTLARLARERSAA